MKILLLTPQLPYPPDQGAGMRNFNTLRYLAGRHEVTLLSFQEPEQPDPLAAGNPLAQLCRAVHTAPVPTRSSGERLRRLLSSRLPDMAYRLSSPDFDRLLAGLLAGETFDVVQIEGIELARVMPLVRQGSPGSRSLFDDHNAEAALQRRTFQADLRLPRRWPAAAYSLVQARRLGAFERRACLEADWVSVVSEADAVAIRALAPGVQPHVIPNSIDISRYVAAEAGPSERFDVVFVGKMDYRPNVDAVLWFADEIWPLIQVERPETTWAVVGQKPHERLERVGRLPGVTVTGRVPLVQPYLFGAGVVIMPLRIGSGTRLKLLEALAAGRPVVSTRIGAEGYPVADGQHLLLADEPPEFAAAVLRLLSDRELARRLGAEGRVLAEQYDWRRIGPLFDAVYRSPPAG